jgi:hypothetical protein
MAESGVAWSFRFVNKKYTALFTPLFSDSTGISPSIENLHYHCQASIF